MESARRRTWATGLTLTERADGLEVEYQGRQYWVRGFSLTPDVLRVVDAAIDNGFVANWVPNRPMEPYLWNGDKYDQGSPAMTFARSTDEHWAFVLDASAHQLEKITFNKKLAGTLDGLDVPYEEESGGGNNLLVPMDKLKPLLAALATRHLPELER